jgi:hypothetical protein
MLFASLQALYRFAVLVRVLEQAAEIDALIRVLGNAQQAMQGRIALEQVAIG